MKIAFKVLLITISLNWIACGLRMFGSGAGGCNLVGTWQRCKINGAGLSTGTQFTASESTIEFTIKTYSNEICTGTPDTTSNFSGNYILSTTAAEDEFNLDLEGGSLPYCGASTSYTMVKFEGCAIAYLPAVNPACSEGARPNTFDSEAYLEQ